MMIVWTSLLLIIIMYPTDCKVRQPDPVMTVSVGDDVTLHCFILEDNNDVVIWYKQTAGRQLDNIVMVQKLVTKPHFFNISEPSRFSIETDSTKCHLKISNVSLSDEAMYYCSSKVYETYFAGGTYLALKGSQNSHKVSVVQRPESESVPSGDTVTLTCSIVSEREASDVRMFWIRSDSEKPVPEILFTQTNQCESESRSCTFSLSRNIMKEDDTGTFYCAVVTCGTILFGNGTRINMVKSVDPLVIVLSVLLCVCVVVITAQAILSQRNNSNKKKGLQNTEKEHPTYNQDRDAVELSYAALHIKEGKSRRANRQRETPQDSVYSQISYSESGPTDQRTAEDRRLNPHCEK